MIENTKKEKKKMKEKLEDYKLFIYVRRKCLFVYISTRVLISDCRNNHMNLSLFYLCTWLWLARSTTGDKRLYCALYLVFTQLHEKL